MKPPVLLDTGPLVALINGSDQYHDACRDAMASFDAPFITCLSVITEAAYLLGEKHTNNPKHVDEVMRWAMSPAIMEIEPIVAADLPDVSALMSKYKIQLADACLLHLAERHSCTDIFTIDRNDFSKARTTSGKALMITP